MFSEINGFSPLGSRSMLIRGFLKHDDIFAGVAT
jgi:hypothetical protein